jgi:hypothetical protein
MKLRHGLIIKFRQNIHSAREHEIRRAALYLRNGVRDGSLSGNGKMRNGNIDSAKSKFDGRMTRRRVHHGIGNQDRVDRRWSFTHERVRDLNRNIRRSERRTQKDADTVTVFSVDGHPCIVKRHSCRRGRHQ